MLLKLSPLDDIDEGKFGWLSTSGRLEHTLLLLADFMCTFSKLLVTLTVVLRGAGMSEAFDSTSWSCAWNGAI